ncbi:enoyl-CoA hydratase [Nocardioides sp. HDW12B]|uniref:enoyl-CoA hydratase n=1 Tax=Nocardioides sp. HDW12B TaxID=2714939 RepID=UPI00140D0F7B|nr:enoyl-CoA hydratase [Nocardioides sp. HDW12B]QIK66502.1 enoyl-CoA hydratase [Nocardioides sp. HDW12B]
MLATRRDGPVTVLELQREERRNALDLDLCRALAAESQRAVDDGARVLVVTGAGTAFCSGADLGGVYGDEFIEALYGMLHGLTRLPVPVVAAVNGPAIGAGTQLALACDLRVADTSAVFGVPTARNGMAVDAWTMRILAAVAGGGVARRLMLAAETVDRDAALGCGLADRAGTLEDALTWAHEIAALAPLTLAHNKLVLNGGADDAVQASFDACWASDDVREAATARSEKRAPVFTGR